MSVEEEEERKIEERSRKSIKPTQGKSGSSINLPNYSKDEIVSKNWKTPQWLESLPKSNKAITNNLLSPNPNTFHITLGLAPTPTSPMRIENAKSPIP